MLLLLVLGTVVQIIWLKITEHLHYKFTCHHVPFDTNPTHTPKFRLIFYSTYTSRMLTTVKCAGHITDSSTVSNRAIHSIRDKHLKEKTIAVLYVWRQTPYELSLAHQNKARTTYYTKSTKKIRIIINVFCTHVLFLFFLFRIIRFH